MALDETKKVQSMSVSRRQLVKAAGATALATAVGSFPISKAQAATPKKGGHAVFGVHGGSATDSFNPTVSPDLMLIMLRNLHGSALTEVSQEGELTPLLAESFEASDGAKTWRFKIRKGVEFHNGKSLTLDDVIATYEFHLNEDSASPMQNVLGDVEGVSKDGDYIVFNLSSANADFAAFLADPNLTIHPSDNGKISWDPPNGTGSYSLEAFEPGVRALMRRNPNYFMEGRGNFETIELLNISDAGARINAFVTGDVHAISDVQTRLIDKLRTVDGVSVLAQTSGAFVTYNSNVSMEPVSDVNVRQALKHAIDREEFVQKILSGYGEIGNDHPIGPTYRFHASDITQNSYDPDKAKYYLSKSGLTSVDVNIHSATDTFQGAVDGAQLFAESAKRSGINITVKREPSDGYWSEVWGKRPMFASYWSQRPAADVILRLAYEGGGAWNVSGFNDERFDMLLKEGRAELDDQKRMEIYREVQEIMRDRGPAIIPAFRQIVNGVSDKIGHNEGPTNSRDLSGGRAPERWWFA